MRRAAAGLLLTLPAAACSTAGAQDGNAVAYVVSDGDLAAMGVNRPHNLAAALNEMLLADPSATAVLERWCAERYIADPPVVVAEVDRAARKPADAATLARLRAGADQVAYRRVRLRCGATVLSIADNWYVPDRLTPAMRAALAGDTPFGKVIRPLDPHRANLAAEFDWPGRAPSELLRHRALVSAADGNPLAEVVETYQIGISAGED